MQQPMSSTDIASCRDRNFEAVFRSLVTTLFAPLRGQCSRPASSIPRLKPRRTVRSTAPSLRPGFEADTGRSHRHEPVFRVCFTRSGVFPSPHSPSGPCEPSGSKRSTGSATRSPSRRTSDRLSLPAASSFDSASDRRSKLASSRSTNRSVNPGTESIMNQKNFAVKSKSAIFCVFPQVFPWLHFNDLGAGRRGFRVHKPARRVSVWLAGQSTKVFCERICDVHVYNVERHS